MYEVLGSMRLKTDGHRRHLRCCPGHRPKQGKRALGSAAVCSEQRSHSALFPNHWRRGKKIRGRHGSSAGNGRAAQLRERCCGIWCRSIQPIQPCVRASPHPHLLLSPVSLPPRRRRRLSLLCKGHASSPTSLRPSPVRPALTMLSRSSLRTAQVRAVAVVDVSVLLAFMLVAGEARDGIVACRLTRCTTDRN